VPHHEGLSPGVDFFEIIDPEEDDRARLTELMNLWEAQDRADAEARRGLQSDDPARFGYFKRPDVDEAA
jgi:hypothetical protein